MNFSFHFQVLDRDLVEDKKCKTDYDCESINERFSKKVRALHTYVCIVHNIYVRNFWHLKISLNFLAAMQTARVFEV